MSPQHARPFSRRRFLGRLMLAGTAGLLGLHPKPVTAEPPPETTKLRVLQYQSICQAPLYVTDELLRLEGFTDVQFVKAVGGVGVLAKNLAAGEVDIGMNFVAPNLLRLDAGDPLVILAGGHIGCLELFGTEAVRALRDLKGKTVALTSGLGGVEHVFIASFTAYVGLNPGRDINWVTHPMDKAVRLFAEGKVDAYLGAPPTAQELRAQKIGHVVVNTAVDRPWSQYFCCMIIAHRDFVHRHPVATKRAIRAILKGADLCALQPDRAAQILVDKDFTKHYDAALQVMQELPYGKWREYDPEDTVRFYALRLHEAGMIKSSPQKIIAQGTDWRFLNELKKELKE
jgi:NitT/TauT family transport system substrate-binding protein